jgi:hypothetical protein
MKQSILKVGMMRISNAMIKNIPFSPYVSLYLSPFPHLLSSFSFPFFLVPSRHGFIKMNFDGASKGNPRPTRYGGIFWDAKSIILRVFYAYVGSSSNNVVKL